MILPESVNNIVIWGFFIQDEYRKLFMFHWSTNNRFVRGWGDVSLTNSSHLSVYTSRFCMFVGAEEAILTMLLYIWVSIFGNFVSVVGCVEASLTVLL